MSQTVKYRRRQALEDPQEWPQNEMGDPERPRQGQHISFRAPDCQQLGDLLSQHDVQQRHDGECDSDSDGMEEPARSIQGGNQQAKNLHHGVFGKPPDGEAGDRDADLGKCQIVADAIDDNDRVLGGFDALPG
jgi:hypothetical protein